MDGCVIAVIRYDMGTGERSPLTRNRAMTSPAFLKNLRSQREEIKAVISSGGVVVYGYIREKTSGTAKAGTLYYVGIASTSSRPYDRHTRGSAGACRLHDVPVPRDHARIRLLSSFQLRAEAEDLEKALILRFGRKGYETAGILLNRTTGGEGTCGHRNWTLLRQSSNKTGIPLSLWTEMDENQRKNILGMFDRGERNIDVFLGKVTRTSLDSAEKYEVSVEFWDSLDRNQKENAGLWYRKGFRGMAIFQNHTKRILELGETKQMQAAAKKYNVNPIEWASFSIQTRAAFGKNIGNGVAHGLALTSARTGIDVRIVKSAHMCTMDLQVFAGLSETQRTIACARHRRGIRGLDLISPEKLQRRESAQEAKVKHEKISETRRFGTGEKLGFYGNLLGAWMQLDERGRRLASQRLRRGWSNADALKGLTA